MGGVCSLLFCVSWTLRSVHKEKWRKSEKKITSSCGPSVLLNGRNLMYGVHPRQINALIQRWKLLAWLLFQTALHCCQTVFSRHKKPAKFTHSQLLWIILPARRVFVRSDCRSFGLLNKHKCTQEAEGDAKASPDSSQRPKGTSLFFRHNWERPENIKIKPWKFCDKIN